MTTASLIRTADSCAASGTRCHHHRRQASAQRRAGRAGQVVTGGPVDRYQRAHRPVIASTRSGSTHTGAPNFLVRRGVAALIAIAAVTGAASIVGLVVASFGGAPAAAAEASPLSPSGVEQVPVHHVAQPGDTLWSIATTYRGSVDHGRYVDALIRLNGGTSIEVGQAVRLP